MRFGAADDYPAADGCRQQSSYDLQAECAAVLAENSFC